MIRRPPRSTLDRSSAASDVYKRQAGGQVGVVAQDDPGAARRHGVGIVALLGQAGDSHVVEANLGQRSSMAIAAPGIAIDLVDELANVLDPIADDQRRVAGGGGGVSPSYHLKQSASGRGVFMWGVRVS